MTAPAAVKATYSDLRFIKSRKVAQVVVEMPIEDAAKFVEMFGTPNPAAETWIALVGLTGNVVPIEQAKEQKRTKLAFQAIKLCQEQGFWRFLREAHGVDTGEKPAANFVRAYCDITTRGALNLNEEAAAKFRDLIAEYKAWQRVA
jgi:hypothetical protein